VLEEATELDDVELDDVELDDGLLELDVLEFDVPPKQVWLTRNSGSPVPSEVTETSVPIVVTNGFGTMYQSAFLP
jgi:hypothetical protein